jgi:hypothetical protein
MADAAYALSARLCPPRLLPARAANSRGICLALTEQVVSPNFDLVLRIKLATDCFHCFRWQFRCAYLHLLLPPCRTFALTLLTPVYAPRSRVISRAALSCFPTHSAASSFSLSPGLPSHSLSNCAIHSSANAAHSRASPRQKMPHVRWSLSAPNSEQTSSITLSTNVVPMHVLICSILAIAKFRSLRSELPTQSIVSQPHLMCNIA